MWNLCIKCNRHKALWEFNKYKEGTFGIQRYCKKCQNAHNKLYRSDNREKRSVYRKQYNVINQHKNNKYSRDYHTINREIILQRQHLYRKNNMDKDAARAAKRRAVKRRFTPELTQEEKQRIALLYTWSDLLGHEFQVDHIVPLSRGGWHHPNNMHIIPRIQNLSKKDIDPKDFYGRFYSFIVGRT